MKNVLMVLLVLPVFCIAQTNNYKEYNTCTDWEAYKGKKNHGKNHCVGWITIREHKNSLKDTVGWSVSTKSFIGDEYEKYERLSERGKYIVDSLKEDGITQLQHTYLTYEPRYMKYGKKTEQLWSIEGEDVVIYEYFFWRDKNGHGFKLLKKTFL